MFRRAFIVIAVGAVALSYLQVKSVEAVPAFARQYDLQCNACHTRPPRLNRFGEQFHMMGFQIPSAAQPGGIVTSVREDGAVKTLIDSLALRIEGGLFEYTASPRDARGPDHGYGWPDDGRDARWLLHAWSDADGRQGRSEHELLLRDQPP